VWKREFDWSAGEVDERERGACGVESVGAADDQLDLVVQRFRAGVGELEPSGGEDPVAVLADRAAELDEWLEAAARQACKQPVDQLANGPLAEARAKIARAISFSAQARGILPPATCSAASVSAWRSVRSSGFFSSDQRASLNVLAASPPDRFGVALAHVHRDRDELGRALADRRLVSGLDLLDCWGFGVLAGLAINRLIGVQLGQKASAAAWPLPSAPHTTRRRR